MKKFFQYFGFNQIEQRGFLVLSALLILILFVPYFFKKLNSSEETQYELVYFEESSKANENAESDYSKAVHYSDNHLRSPKKDNISYFSFDPNQLDDSSWKKLGFTDSQIKVIKNYEAKGGRFYKKEDVAKIYVISTEDYKRIESYIVINNKKNENPEVSKSDKATKPTAAYKPLTIDINLADTSEWKVLKGIGSVLSKRIVKYRESLGGFYSVEQVREVYGLPIETFESIKANLDSPNNYMVKKININTSPVDELSKHPYINKKLAQTIVNYRTQHGDFKSFESLSQIQSLDHNFLRKIEHYLEY